MCDKLLGHCLRKVGVNYCNVGGDFKVGDRILYALIVIGYDGEGCNLGSGAGCRGDGTEFRFLPQGGDTEYLAHFLKGNVGIFVFYPHGLCRVDRRTAAHGDYPVRLEFQHCVRAAHNGINGGIGFNSFKKLNFKARFFKISDSLVQKTEFLHRASASADHGFLSAEAFKSLQSSLSVIKVAR